MHQNDRTFSLYIGTMASNGMHKVKEQWVKMLELYTIGMELFILPQLFLNLDY
jgi:hypothetical protein